MSQIFRLLVVLPFFFLSLSARSQLSSSPELVIHLLDYLAKDYAGAVKDGEVLSQGEYDEQVEFIRIVEDSVQKISILKLDSEFSSEVSRLSRLINSKASADEVSKLARALQQSAILLAKIEIAPRATPNLKAGANLFQTNCTSCHGSTGHGDGFAGVSLDPKPANFHDPDLVAGSSPYKFYNTIRLGVPGTGMIAFANLTDEEVWNLAFYLKSLPYQERPGVTDHRFTLKELASLTDEELSAKLGGEKVRNQLVIASVRTNFQGSSSSDTLGIAVQLLKESLQQASTGNYSEANALGIRAYLEGVEPLEPKMKANIPGLVEHLEALMSQYRSSLENRESFELLKPQVSVIIGKLEEAGVTLSQTKMSSQVAFWAAFSIFLREGFEAVLIIIVLVSILKAMGQPQAIRWVHFGWVAAVVTGIGAWFASGVLLTMSGMSRELLEGIISLLAVVVLLYVGFWLHRYSEMKKWRAFLEEKLRHGLNSRSYALLAAVSFMAVFREAFEVVLFLRAIWIDLNPSGQKIASFGILTSVVMLMGLAYLAIIESRRLPLSLLFQICSWTMIVLAFILAGKGAHSLQEAGMLPISILPINFRFDMVGLFPTLETLLAQAVLLATFAGLLFTERRPNRI